MLPLMVQKSETKNTDPRGNEKTYPSKGKRKIIFKYALGGDMLVPSRVISTGKCRIIEPSTVCS